MAETESGEIILLDQAALERAPADAAMQGAQAESSPARRSARVPVAFRLWLRREQRGCTWEEETETQLVSRYGAGLECRHRIEPGAQLALTRRDTGQRATARVAYSRYNEHGCREIGLELVGCDNFWELDWETLARDADPVPADSTVSGPANSAALAASDGNVSAPADVTVSVPADTPAASPLDTAAASAASSLAEHCSAGVSPAVLRAENDGFAPSDAAEIRRRDAGATKRRVSRDAFAEKLIALQCRLYAALTQGDAHAVAEMVAPEALWVTSSGVEAGAPDAAALLGFDTLAAHETLSVLKLNRGTAVVTGTLAALSAEPGQEAASDEDRADGSLESAGHSLVSADRSLETAAASAPIAAYCASVWMQRGRRWLLVLHQITRAV